MDIGQLAIGSGQFVQMFVLDAVNIEIQYFSSNGNIINELSCKHCF